MNVNPEYATLSDMIGWAGMIMLNEPDFVIGDDYLRRWFVVPRNRFCNVYLHEIRKSDDERAMHDHPWPNASYIIAGRLIEHTPQGQFLRVAGDYVERPAEALHRLELVNGEPCISLFTTGQKVREWGFACHDGWVPWQMFCDPGNKDSVGRGCGEQENTA
ncbi:hypothetical protein [Alterisphingorhabdus coralli]|uniref:Cupin domain-containing protein n=1 Tax=Alterisphingorhabdus coralli TaxID=3071408 RepID=A0AA97I1R7_9SPHN|nr:hypothetical protein [Parasphingorhabdus sp. SCSIO 66989]WOE76352.1 hypothetical protein RB602_06465 [Parasphingorhabdus sp. SCSIO 66989]